MGKTAVLKLVIMLLALIALSTYFESHKPGVLVQAQLPSALVCQDETCLSASFNYLIVTRPLFIESLVPFAEWKAAAGYRVGLATVEWMDQRFEGRHVAERMKTAMHALRRQAGVVYVLLVGDTLVEYFNFKVEAILDSYVLDEPWNVPTGYYRRIETDPPGEVLPSDVYFVEDRDWDAQGIGTSEIANPNGEGSFDATLFVGRWTVQTPEDIAPILSKTMRVSPADSVWFTVDATGLSTDEVCPTDWPPPSNPEARPPRFKEFFCYLDTMVKARSVFEASPWLQTEYSAVDVHEPAQTTALRERLLRNEDPIVISYHGSHDCMLLGSQCVSAKDLRFESVFPLFEAESCLIATFYFSLDGSESFSETLLKAETGPALVTQAPNPYLFLIGLRKGQSVGEALWRSGATYVYWPNPMLLLGDPSLQVFVLPPERTGATDADGDGVSDAADYCPTYPGKPESNGC